MNPKVDIFSSFKNINFSKILTNANKTLTFIGKAVPMYQEIKPTFNNIKKMFNNKVQKKEDEIYSSRPIKLIKNTNNPIEERNFKNDTLTFFV